MTDELAKYGAGSYIETFVSDGPKFYALRIKDPDGKYHDVIRIKGTSLNCSTVDKINFEVLEKIVSEDKSITLNLSVIRRNKNHEIFTKPNESKICCADQRKRVHTDVNKSVPYGYNQQKLDSSYVGSLRSIIIKVKLL